MEVKGFLRAFTLSGVTFSTVKGGKHRPAIQIAGSTWTLTAVRWAFTPKDRGRGTDGLHFYSSLWDPSHSSQMQILLL